MKFPAGRPNISHSEGHKITVTLTFDIQAPTFYQLIFESKWMSVPNLRTFRQADFKVIVRDRKCAHYLITTMAIEGSVFESTKHLWSLRGKKCCSQIQYNSSKCDPFLMKQIVWCHPNVQVIRKGQIFNFSVKYSFKISCSRKHKHTLWGHRDLNLWSLSTKMTNYIPWVSVNVCARCNEILFGHSWYIEFKTMQGHVTLTFSPSPKCNQFIVESKWIFILNLMTFPQADLKISRKKKTDMELWV